MAAIFQYICQQMRARASSFPAAARPAEDLGCKLQPWCRQFRVTLSSLALSLSLSLLPQQRRRCSVLTSSLDPYDSLLLSSYYTAATRGRLVRGCTCAPFFSFSRRHAHLPLRKVYIPRAPCAFAQKITESTLLLQLRVRWGWDEYIEVYWAQAALMYEEIGIFLAPKEAE